MYVYKYLSKTLIKVRFVRPTRGSGRCTCARVPVEKKKKEGKK